MAASLLLPIFAKCDALPKGDLFDMFQESIHDIPLGNSKPPLPTRSLRSLRAAVCSTRLHHAHPFVAAAEENLSHAKKQRVRSRSCGLQDLLRNIPISDVSM